MVQRLPWAVVIQLGTKFIAVRIETRLRVGRPGFNCRHGPPLRPDRLWGPPSLLTWE